MRRAHLVNDEFKAQLNRKSLKYNWHDAQVTVLEGVMARGDRRIGKLIEEAYRLGCLFDSWTESFHNELWMQAFENTGIDLEFYNLRERSEDELFPWDFIDIGVSRKFLRREWERAMKETVTPNCRMQCSGCGAAKFGGGVCYESKNYTGHSALLDILMSCVFFRRSCTGLIFRSHLQQDTVPI